MADGEEAATESAPESSEEGNAADGSEATREAGTASGGESFIERMRRDPEFAIQQYKEVQKAQNRASQQAKAAEPVLEMAKTLGNGDLRSGIQAIQQHLQNYGSVRGNKTLAKMVDTYLQTGKLGGVEDALDETEEEDPTQAEIQALRKKVADLERGTSKTAIQRDIEKTVEEFPADYRKAAMEAIEERIGELDRQAQNGYEAAGNALKQLNRRALRTIAVSGLLGDAELGQSELIRIADHFKSENLDHKRSKDTGGTGVRSTGREPSTKPSTALQALREAKEKQARGEL